MSHVPCLVGVAVAKAILALANAGQLNPDRLYVYRWRWCRRRNGKDILAVSGLDFSSGGRPSSQWRCSAQ